MSKVFLSFLGAGNYSELLYEHTAKKTRFVQAAILQKHGENFFDRIWIIYTETSHKKNWESLYHELTQWSDEERIQAISITENLQKDQWTWFTTILDLIDEGDEVWFDLTHGYRAFSIILSAAIGFIQRSKKITLQAVYYGGEQAENHPIVDMKDFYIINEWADSVGRLTDDADARKLGELARFSEIDALKGLGDEALIEAFNEMTDCIRNVDVNNVSSKVTDALELVREHQQNTSGAAKLLLELVWQKFSNLKYHQTISGHYDAPYFKMQLKIIQTLLEHKLFMQAFTAMRECIASLGMVNLPPKYLKKVMSPNSKRFRYRRRFAEVMVNMFQHHENDWNFHEQDEEKKRGAETLMPWYTILKKEGIEAQLRSFVSNLVKIRNGFDHAWTSQVYVEKEIGTTGEEYFRKLEKIINAMIDKALIPQPPEAANI